MLVKALTPLRKSENPIGKVDKASQPRLDVVVVAYLGLAPH